MSYDLYFNARQESAVPNREQLLEFFERKPNFGVNKAQVLYQNDTTGVYFSFDLYDRTEDFDLSDEAEPPKPFSVPIALNLNYFRPHIFGLEAEIAVGDFVHHFDLQVDDPQTGGMGFGEYSREGFLRGWDRGNELAYGVFMGREGAIPAHDIHPLPTDELERCWRWNLMREQLSNALLDEDIFVPRIMFLASETRTLTVAVWGDGVSIAMPEVDCVFCPRVELRPDDTAEEQDIVVFEWEELQETLANYPLESFEGGSFRNLNYDLPPAPIAELIRGKLPTAEQFHSIATDSILNLELVEKYGGLNPPMES